MSKERGLMGRREFLIVSSTVAVAGTLEFQACDDKVCFVPESVPVSWTVTIK